MLYTATMLVRSYRGCAHAIYRVEEYMLLVTSFFGVFLSAPTIIERVKIKFSPTANKHPLHSNKTLTFCSAFPATIHPTLFKQNMKLSTILFP